MAAEALRMRRTAPSAQRVAVPGLASLTALLGREIDSSTTRWLRDHWTAFTLELDRQVVRVEERDSTIRPDGDPALDLVARALHARPIDRRTAVGDLELAAQQFDRDDALSLLFTPRDSSRAVGWAVGSARGSVLLVPEELRLPATSTRTRALFVARSPHELPALVTWSRLLAPAVEIDLRAVFSPRPGSHAAVLREHGELIAALRRTRDELEATGRHVCIDEVLVDDPPEDEAGLVVSVARRPRWRRWFAGPDRAACKRPRARLLIAPHHVALPHGGVA